MFLYGFLFFSLLMEQVVFGISGEPGAGKDTVKEYLVEQYGAESLGFSLILKDILNRLSLPLERANYASLGEALRNSFGENILATVLSLDVSRMSTSVVVIDGIRKFGELEELRKLKNFRFLFVETDMHVRYERVKARGIKADDKEKTFEEFVRDREHAADREVRNLKSEADAVIENNGTLGELHRHVDEVVSGLS